MSKSLKTIIIESVVSVAIIIFLLTLLNGKSNELDIANSNLRAATDSIEMYELKNGALVYEINSYILEKKQLEQYLDVSKKEVKDLEKKLGDALSYISKVEGQVKYDTITMHDTVVWIDDVAYADILYNDQWISIEGQTKIDKNQAQTTLNNIVVPVPLKVGLTDNYNIWVESENPYLTITELKGAVVKDSPIIQKPKRWGIGPYIGVGANFGYGIGNSSVPGLQVGLGVSVGISVHYSVIQW